MTKRTLQLLITMTLVVTLAVMLGCTPTAKRTTGTFKEFKQSADGQTLAVVVVDGSQGSQTAWIKIRGLTPGEKVILEESGKPGASGVPTLTVVGHKR